MKSRKGAAKAAPKNATGWPGATMWKLASIKPYPNNPRTHPPAQIKLLAGWMKDHGVDQPIVVDEEGYILKGHGRREAAEVAGFDEFPVVQHLGLTEDQKRAMRIADNALPLLSGWDQTVIRTDLQALKLAHYDLSKLGFSATQLVTFETVPKPPDSFPEYGEDIETSYECPSCHYKWSGAPRPKGPEEPPAPVPKPRRRTAAKKK